ncbi:MAG: protein kinase [Cyanobacteria bacterium]|nr:protein kinase [Cyanobacteriota bacterium]
MDGNEPPTSEDRNEDAGKESESSEPKQLNESVEDQDASSDTPRFVDTPTQASAPSSTSRTENQDSLVGQIINDRFRIESMLGRGGMASVYKARHLIVDRSVAIKLLHRNHCSDIVLRRFTKEGRVLSNLSHPNIISFLDFGMLPSGEPYLVMDYLDGLTLAQLIKKSGALPLRDVLEIFLQLCDGLQHAHSKGVRHRDLKPSNVMIFDSADGRTARIFDFGIAKLLSEDSDDKQLTQTGEVFGSPLYMSPEQCRGLSIDERSDIYSLGCALYEALSGRAPLEGANALLTIQMHASQIPVPICELCPELPIQLNSILRKCLAKDPDDRYGAVSDLRFELEMLSHSAKKTGLASTSSQVSGGEKLPVITSGAPSTAKVANLTSDGRMRRADKIALIIMMVGILMIPLSLLLKSVIILPKNLDLIVSLGMLCMAFSCTLVAVLHGAHATALLRKLFPEMMPETILIPAHLRPVNRALAVNLRSFDDKTGVIALGEEISTGEEFYIADYMREHNPHALLVGKHGSGKTCLLASMLVRDICFESDCIIAIDRKGDLASLIKSWIEKKPQGERASERLSTFAPCAKIGLGFNPLVIEGLSPEDRASIVVDAWRTNFDKFASAHRWMPQTSLILENAVVLLILAGRSLDDLVAILTSDDERKGLFEEVNTRGKQWSASTMYNAIDSLKRILQDEQFEKFVAPILEMATDVLTDSASRAMLLAEKNAFDLEDIMKKKQILLVNLPKDAGGMGANLLATIVVASVQRLRESLYRAEEKLIPCQLYFDDFRSSIDAALFDSLTTRDNRRLKLGVIASTTTIERLPANFRDLIFARSGLLLVFQVDFSDAALLARNLVPADSIYSSSSPSMHESLQALIEYLIALKPREYLLWMREATAGLFSMKAPYFDESLTRQ